MKHGNTLNSRMRGAFQYVEKCAVSPSLSLHILLFGVLRVGNHQVGVLRELFQLHVQRVSPRSWCRQTPERFMIAQINKRSSGERDAKADGKAGMIQKFERNFY